MNGMPFDDPRPGDARMLKPEEDAPGLLCAWPTHPDEPKSQLLRAEAYRVLPDGSKAVPCCVDCLCLPVRPVRGAEKKPRVL